MERGKEVYSQVRDKALDGARVTDWTIRYHPSQVSPLHLAKVPVVVLTGSVYPEDRRRATELGAIGFEIKPIDTAEFAAIANNIRARLPITTIPPG